jgi:hypothetical protein
MYSYLISNKMSRYKNMVPKSLLDSLQSTGWLENIHTVYTPSLQVNEANYSIPLCLHRYVEPWLPVVDSGTVLCSAQPHVV